MIKNEIQQSIMDGEKEIRDFKTQRRESLLFKTVKSKNKEVTEAEQAAKIENDIFKQITTQKALMAAKELANGVIYSKNIDSGWKPSLNVRIVDSKSADSIRSSLNIAVDGENVPAPVNKFKDLRLPRSILNTLKKKKIEAPFKIQIQGLPIGLSGRDMVGVSYTGSGKTLTFVIPMVMVSYQEELRLPLRAWEGPIGFVLCPSRELARQTYEQTVKFSDDLWRDRIVVLRSILCSGGLDSKFQTDIIRRFGAHMLIATPGRLKDHLHKKKIKFDHCRFVCLDEADRMIDFGFEEDIRDVWSFFLKQRQTLMFSATMPIKILEFAKSALVNPIILKVSRMGAANINIIQQVEYVKSDHRLSFLRHCISRSSPPVLIFAENKSSVDEIHEYLLIKGLDVVAVHGSKSQEERDLAIKQFKSGYADVLVATDVASKGLDFPNVKHVINYDMAKDIENYIHRIGRTGRGSNKGLATTFINKESSALILRDLKCLLKEGGQRLPPLLRALHDSTENISSEVTTMTDLQGCVYCGGMGHRVRDCPKLRAENTHEIRKFGCNIYYGKEANL